MKYKLRIDGIDFFIDGNFFACSGGTKCGSEVFFYLAHFV